MSAKLSSLRKRLATLEQEQADRAKVEELANCNCPESKSAMSFLAVCQRLKIQSSEKFRMSLEEPAKESSAQSSPANLSRKRPASERRIQANRLNALRSTGPTTARGKRTVARNAIKHGFLAREVVITAGDGRSWRHAEGRRFRV